MLGSKNSCIYFINTVFSCEIYYYKYQIICSFDSFKMATLGFLITGDTSNVKEKMVLLLNEMNMK